MIEKEKEAQGSTLWNYIFVIIFVTLIMYSVIAKPRLKEQLKIKATATPTEQICTGTRNVVFCDVNK